MPLGAQSTAYTSSAWPGRSTDSFLVLRSHTLSVLSLLPLSSSRLSADHATMYTGATWPLSVARNAPVTPSHSFTALSKDADATCLPSGENTTWLMSWTCPVMRALGFFSAAGSHMNMVKSSLPEMRRSGSPPVSSLYRSAALFLPSSALPAATPWWSKGPVRSACSEERHSVLTQCPWPLSCRISFPSPDSHTQIVVSLLAL
mmetsp:Transcript_6838/g.24163  ORF Transcript_6838/g.24163 Transcript_6838/m.24163 type:complete len:203 (+) Transcript_6838:242-850(+)